jgi:hypothetical protein
VQYALCMFMITDKHKWVRAVKSKPNTLQHLKIDGAFHNGMNPFALLNVLLYSNFILPDIQESGFYDKKGFLEV